MKFPDSCNWYLIATDGVYITEEDIMNYPLSNHSNELLMAPGGRADVLFTCTEPGKYTIYSTRDNSVDSTGQVENLAPIAYDNANLFSIVVGSTTTTTPFEATDWAETTELIPAVDDLPESSDYPPKPSDTYIQTFCPQTNVTKNCSQETDCHFNLRSPPGKQHINGRSFNLTDTGLTFRHLVEDLHLGIMEVNSSMEFTINNGPVAHVYHQHVNPFQVMHNVASNGFIALKCTWWDSLGNYGGANGNENNITVKTWTRGHWLAPIARGYFGQGGGLIIIHCHLLQHEGINVVLFVFLWIEEYMMLI